MDETFNRVARRRRKGQGGFTLIELLVVIAVLAVLAGIVIFNVVGVANKGASSAACTDGKSVQTAVDAALNDAVVFDGTPMGSLTDPWTLIAPKYIHTAPPATYGATAVSFTLSGSQTTGWTVGVTGFTC
jgi:prepilin-type N-terminal cleavage/methylation domain-containing protein